MRITDLKIDSFGIWRRLKIEEFSPHLTVIYGANEAGKTTLLEFIRGMLYGFVDPERSHYLNGSAAVQGRGGSLLVNGSQGELLLARRMRSSLADGDELTLRSVDGEVPSQQVLKVLLADVDAATYGNVFAFGLRELQQLGTLQATAAAQWLYSITSGLERVSLVDLQRELTTNRRHILDSGSGSGTLALLLEKRTRLQAQIAELADQSQQWFKRIAQHRRLQEQVSQLTQETDTLAQDQKAIQAALAVRDLWRQRMLIDERLEREAPSGEVPAETVERLEMLLSRLSEGARRRDRARAQRRQAHEQLKSLAVNEKLWKHGPRLEALSEQQGWLASLDEQIDRLRGEVDQLQSKWRGYGSRFGINDGEKWEGSIEIPPPLQSQLQKKAKAVAETSQRRTAAEQEISRSMETAASLEAEIAGKLAARPQKQLQPALEAAGIEVANLDRRIGLDERLEQLDTYRQQLELQITQALDRQLMPVWLLASLGGIFVLAAVVLVISFWLSSTIAGTLGLLLTVVGVTGALSKFFMERSASERSDACRKQLDMLERQKESVEQERAALDKKLSRGSGPLAGRLEKARSELEALEELLPLDTRRATAQQDAAAAEVRIAQLKQEEQAAQEAWHFALGDAGLPEDLSPDQLRTFVGYSDEVSDLRRRLDVRRAELQQRTSERRAICDRILRIMHEVGEQPRDKETPAQQITRLLEKLKTEEANVEQREELLKQRSKARRAQVRYARRIAQMERQRRELLEQAGCEDEQQFRALSERLSVIAELRAERATIQGQLTAALPKGFSAADLEPWLTADVIDTLDERLKRAAEKSSENQQRLFRVHQECGELTQQVRALSEDRRLSRARMELAAVEAQIRHLSDQWRQYAVTGLLLEQIRKEFEQHRQPEAMLEASQYLRQLTQGRYPRVWTPLGEDVLYVEDAHGKTWSIEMLSRGTREQLFLAIRLALVALFARRGAVLPVVLDDVLVNFDVHRAEAAAGVLRDFARQGHQLLLFTCHQHVCRIFQELQVDVRELPADEHEDVTLLPSDPRARIPVQQLPHEPAAEVASEVDEPVERAEEISPLPAADIEDQPVEEEEYEWEYIYEEADQAAGDAEPDEAEVSPPAVNLPVQEDDEEYVLRPGRRLTVQMPKPVSRPRPVAPPPIPRVKPSQRLKVATPLPREAAAAREGSGTHGWDVEFEDEWNDSTDRWNDEAAARRNNSAQRE